MLILYAKLKKTLYGTLEAALLFQKLLSKTLKERGIIHASHNNLPGQLEYNPTS